MALSAEVLVVFWRKFCFTCLADSLIRPSWSFWGPFWGPFLVILGACLGVANVSKTSMGISFCGFSETDSRLGCVYRPGGPIWASWWFLLFWFHLRVSKTSVNLAMGLSAEVHIVFLAKVLFVIICLFPRNFSTYVVIFLMGLFFLHLA